MRPGSSRNADVLSFSLGLALQIGFLRMSGRLLDAVRIIPPLLWRHLGERFGGPLVCRAITYGTICVLSWPVGE